MRRTSKILEYLPQGPYDAFCVAPQPLRPWVMCQIRNKFGVIGATAQILQSADKVFIQSAIPVHTTETKNMYFPHQDWRRTRAWPQSGFRMTMSQDFFRRMLRYMQAEMGIIFIQGPDQRFIRTQHARSVWIYRKFIDWLRDVLLAFWKLLLHSRPTVRILIVCPTLPNQPFPYDFGCKSSSFN